MAEQRLIDANNLGIGMAFQSEFSPNYFAIGWNSALKAVIEVSPTIDPETLPIVHHLREELAQYKDLGVTPEQIALLMKFFKDRTSAKWIAADMELVADSIRKSNLEKQLARVTAERDAAYRDLKLIEEECLCSVCSHYNEPDLFCADCKGRPYIATDTFEWRGQQKGEGR